MKFSEDRISHLAHLIHDGLYQDMMVDYPDEDKALKEIKKMLNDYFKIEDEVDDVVRAKITSLKRGVLEGSREWEVLYKKYYEEEMSKRGR